MPICARRGHILQLSRKTQFVLFLCFVAVPASAQFGGVKIKWTCPAEGRFRVAHCKDCAWHYCYDGQHFFQEDGPVPSWVKAYFDNLIKKMEQDRAEIARKGEEARAKWEQSKIDTARQSAEGVRRSQEWNDRFNRRAHVLSPSMQVVSVDPPSPARPELAPQPVAPEKLAEVKIGMERAGVVANLGVPQSSISIPEETGLVETLNYLLSNGRGVKIRIQAGRVSEIKQ